MNDASAARLAILWHMHQPPYAVAADEPNVLPWVRLHAAGAYLDMAVRLGRHPQMAVTVNFSGVLLEQWAALAADEATDQAELLCRIPAASLTAEQQRELAARFFSVHPRRIAASRRYTALQTTIGAWARGGPTPDVEAWRDLQIWFHLAWTGPALRAMFPGLMELVSQDEGFSESDKEVVLGAISAGLRTALALWRELVAGGVIEVSATPWAHPILPLLLDTRSATEGLPTVPMPTLVHEQRTDAVWHVSAGLERATAVLGATPVGMWPAEGSVSAAAAEVFAAAGVRWIASDEQVLARSETVGDANPRHVWQLQTPSGPIAMVFRDLELSDRIGFVYARRAAQPAVDELLDAVAARGQGGGVVALILDGENAWETYPDDGEAFLDALYRDAVARADILPVTVGRAVAESVPRQLLRLHAGSWIGADFRIWIGSAVKNAAWDLLTTTRMNWEIACRRGTVLEQARGWDAMRRAQASDWFWWYGDDNTSQEDERFDALFRACLARVWESMGQDPPEQLQRPVWSMVAAGAPSSRAPEGLVHVTVDGRETDPFEWRYAGWVQPSGGTMHGGRRLLGRVYYGQAAGNMALRADPAPGGEWRLGDSVEIETLWEGPGSPGARKVVLCLQLDPLGAVRVVGRGGEALAEVGVRAAWGDVIELVVAGAGARWGLGPSGEARLQVTVRRGAETDQLSAVGPIPVGAVPDWEALDWMV